MDTTDPQEAIRLQFRRLIPINERTKYGPRAPEDVAALREIVAACDILRPLVGPHEYVRIYAEEKTRHTYGAGR